MPDRDRATIEALKIALEQAAATAAALVDLIADPARAEAVEVDVERWRAMARPRWEALPAVESGTDEP